MGHLPRHGLIAGFLAVALSIVACAGPSGEESTTTTEGQTGAPTTSEAQADIGTLQLGTQPWIGYGPLDTLAPAIGAFESHGLTVEITNFRTDVDINSALASGRLDAASVGITQALNFAEAGIDLKIVLLQDVSSTADAILARDLSTVAELEGARVAVEEGTISDLLLRYALSTVGLTIDDIQIVPTPAADAGAALIAGRIDAAVTYEPFITEAQALDETVKAIFTAGDRDGLISDVLIVRSEVISERPEQVLALVRAWAEGLDYYREATSDAQDMIAENLGTDPEDLRTAFDGIEYFDLAANQEQLAGPFVDLIDDVQRIMVDAGLLGSLVDAGSIVDPQFVNQAAG